MFLLVRPDTSTWRIIVCVSEGELLTGLSQPLKRLLESDQDVWLWQDDFCVV